MSTEVITLDMKVLEWWIIMKKEKAYLSLKKVSGDDFAPVTVEECQGSAEGRRRNTPENSLSNDTPPSGLGALDGCKTSQQRRLTDGVWHTILEEFIKKQGLQLGILGISCGDVLEENALR